MDWSAARRPESLARVTQGAVLVAGAGVLLLHPLRPDYDPARRYLSEFAVGAFAPLMVLVFLALGGALLALGGAIAGTAGAGPRRRAPALPGVLTLLGAGLLGLSGAGMVVTGLYPTDLSLPGTAPTRTGAIHNRAAGVAFQSALAAMVVLGAGLGSDARWRPRRRWLLPAAALTGVALGAFAVLYVAALWGWPGWPQRTLLGAILAWLYLTAWRLRALRSGHAGRPGGQRPSAARAPAQASATDPSAKVY
jgi:hypothetical protein